MQLTHQLCDDDTSPKKIHAVVGFNLHFWL